MDEKDENLDSNWFRKHAETLTVIASLLGGFIWMDSKFNAIETKFDAKIEKLDVRLSTVEKDIAVIKTVLSFKGINCPELAAREEKNKE